MSEQKNSGEAIGQTDEALRQILKKWMDDNDKKASFVARNLGISEAQLSQWFGNKYQGDNDRLHYKIRAFLSLQEARAARRKIEPVFIPTSVAKRIHETAQIAHEDCIIGVVVSNAGLGKTVALKEYANQHPDTIYIEIDHGYNAESFFIDIHKRLFGIGGHKQLHDMHVDIIDIMRGSGRMIIVDQAEYLPHKALEMLRSVYDKAGIGILLAGMPRLLENIRGSRGQFAQLHSRVGIVVKLDTITTEDAEAICESILGEPSKFAASFCSRSFGNARHMVKMINAAVRIARVNKIDINEDVISKAQEMVRV
jgi:hypothetical protein